jgi:molybdopterin/thiamine biosynthesis adenylyltransferase
MGKTQELARKLQSHIDAMRTDLNQPQLLRPLISNHRKRLEGLLETEPGITVYDQLTSQLESLLRSRHPGRRITPTELRTLVTEHLQGVPPEEYGIWVYYPWSLRLVHILDEAEFVELRTNRNQHKITREEHDVLAEKKVGVVGLSVGQSVAMNLAMERSCGELRIADFDSLELSNLNRIRTGVHNLGVSKVEILAREIAELDPFLRVRCFPQGVTADNLDQFLTDGGKLSLLIEECDSLDIKVLCRQRAREHRIPVVMETSDRGILDIERFDLESNRPIFHGKVKDLDPQHLKDLRDEEKIPFALSILGIDSLSPRMRASLLEVGQSLTSWPQPATSVMLGSAVAADACRRILLDTFHESGRFFVDLEELVTDGLAKEAITQTMKAPTSKTGDPQVLRLTERDMESMASKVDHEAGPTQIQPNRDIVKRLVHAATLAPSGGNVQPWRWLFRGGKLFLFHDKERSVCLLDFLDRASHMALGAAAENLVLEAHAQSLEVELRKFPIPNDSRLACIFTFHENADNRKVSQESHERDPLVAFISERSTNRKLSRRQLIPQEKMRALVDVAATVPGVQLDLVTTEDQLSELGEIVGATERLRMLHPQAHADFIKEVRWTQEEAVTTRDGIDLATVELSPWQRSGLQVAKNWLAVKYIKKWGGGAVFETLSRQATESASAMGLLTMSEDDPVSYFDGGRAVEAIWLEANRHGIAFQPLTPITFLFLRLLRGKGEGLTQEMHSELPALRERFLTIFPNASGRGEIFLFRLFYAAPPSARSLRRSVDDVLTIS